MSEETKTEEKETKQSETVEDQVKREDYNKVVENANSLKADNEKLAKEMKEMQDTIEKKETENKEKMEWEKEKAEKDKQIAELKAKAQEGEKVAKGKVATENPAATTQGEQTKEEMKAKIDEQLGKDDEFDPKKVPSGMARYAHYKNPQTRKFTEEQLGKGLSLHAGAQSSSKGLVAVEALKDSKDIILNKQ